MKFASAKVAARCFFSSCLLMVACLVQAGESKTFFSETPSKGEGNKFTQKSDELEIKPEDKTLYHVRCWQHGMLIIDEPNWRDPQLQTRFVAMKPPSGSSPGLYLVDFNNTFCEIKKR
jgi:hypothetical protein